VPAAVSRQRTHSACASHVRATPQVEPTCSALCAHEPITQLSLVQSLASSQPLGQAGGAPPPPADPLVPDEPLVPTVPDEPLVPEEPLVPDEPPLSDVPLSPADPALSSGAPLVPPSPMISMPATPLPATPLPPVPVPAPDVSSATL